MMPKLVVFAAVKKAPSLERKIFLKKNSSSLFVQIRSSRWCAEFLKNKWVSRYLTFGDFSKKSFFTIKLLIKLDRQKIEKIPHTVLEKIISQIIPQNFYKVGLNPEELELLECTGYHLL